MPENMGKSEEAAERLLMALGIPMSPSWREERAKPLPHGILVHRSFEALVWELVYLNATGILKCGGESWKP
ncbi:MAG: hypothetical protein QI199_02325 [Candidatus Korarchaeota archaeon]|nr:hypothetical protein [Candidatus Korarchaeota archaeon]